MLSNCCQILGWLLVPEEWIKKLWYIYMREYYSAIKRNTFESNEVDEPRAYYTE